MCDSISGKCSCHTYVVFMEMLKKFALGNISDGATGWRTFIGYFVCLDHAAKEPYNKWLICEKWLTSLGIL